MEVKLVRNQGRHHCHRSHRIGALFTLINPSCIHSFWICKVFLQLVIGKLALHGSPIQCLLPVHLAIDSWSTVDLGWHQDREDLIVARMNQLDEPLAWCLPKVEDSTFYLLNDFPSINQLEC